MSTPYKLLKELIAFYQKSEEGVMIKATLLTADRRVLRVVVIKLLPWLKSGGTAGEILALNAKSSWGTTLIQLANENAAFGSLVQVDGNSVTLNQDISSEERQLIKKTAQVGYNPPLMPKRHV